MTDTEIARACGVTRQAVAYAKECDTPTWRRRYSIVAAGQPDPGQVGPKSAAARACAAAGTTYTAVASRLGVSRRHIYRAFNGELPDLLARVQAEIAAIIAERAAVTLSAAELDAIEAELRGTTNA